MQEALLLEELYFLSILNITWNIKKKYIPTKNIVYLMQDDNAFLFWLANSEMCLLRDTITFYLAR